MSVHNSLPPQHVHNSSLHRPPESYRPVTSAPARYHYNPYSHVTKELFTFTRHSQQHAFDGIMRASERALDRRASAASIVLLASRMLNTAASASPPRPSFSESFSVSTVEIDDTMNGTVIMQQRLLRDVEARRTFMSGKGSLVAGAEEQVLRCDIAPGWMAVAGGPDLAHPASWACDNRTVLSDRQHCQLGIFWHLPSNATFVGHETMDGRSCDRWEYWEGGDRFALWASTSGRTPVATGKIWTSSPNHLWHIVWRDFVPVAPPASEFAISAGVHCPAASPPPSAATPAVDLTASPPLPDGTGLSSGSGGLALLVVATPMRTSAPSSAAVPPLVRKPSTVASAVQLANCSASDSRLAHMRALICNSLVQEDTAWCGKAWRDASVSLAALSNHPSCLYACMYVCMQAYIINTHRHNVHADGLQQHFPLRCSSSLLLRSLPPSNYTHAHGRVTRTLTTLCPHLASLCRALPPAGRAIKDSLAMAPCQTVNTSSHTESSVI